MKKLMKFGAVKVETRTNVRGNVPDGLATQTLTDGSGRCYIPQFNLPGAGDTFTAITQC